MKVSDLAKELAAIAAVHPDLEVLIDADADGVNIPRRITVEATCREDETVVRIAADQEDPDDLSD